MITLNALTAADEVIVPMPCEFFALDGLAELMETIRRIQAGPNPRLKLGGILLTMAEERTNLGAAVAKEVRQAFPGQGLPDLHSPQHPPGRGSKPRQARGLLRPAVQGRPVLPQPGQGVARRWKPPRRTERPSMNTQTARPGPWPHVAHEPDRPGRRHPARSCPSAPWCPTGTSPAPTSTKALLEDLAASLKTHGMVQPIVARKVGDSFEIIAGERRWRAARKAGLATVPVVLKEIPDDRLLEFALVENIQRQELNAIEEAKAYLQLGEHLRLTQEQVADRVGKSRPQVANTLRLLRLPIPVQELVAFGQDLHGPRQGAAGRGGCPRPGPAGPGSGGQAAQRPGPGSPVSSTWAKHAKGKTRRQHPQASSSRPRPRS